MRMGPALCLLAVASAPAGAVAPTRMGPAESPIASSVEVPADSRIIYVSGQVPEVANAAAAEGTVERFGDTETQTRSVIRKIEGALKPHGLALQWIGHRPPTQYRLLMRTFLDVFPDATLWFDGNLMVGSLEPLRLDRAAFEAKRQDPRTRSALDEIGLTSFDVLRSWYTAGPDELRRYAGAGPVLTDDRPLLEYHLSLPADPEPLDLSALRGDVNTIVR